MDRGRVCEPQANTTAQTSQRLDQEVANPKSSGAANSVAAQIAKLQQTIGNRAVIRQLLRNGEREEAASAPSNGLARARTPLVIPLRSRHSRGAPPAPIHVARDEDPQSAPAPAVDLSNEYETAVRMGDWAAAAEWLNGFNREDIQARLGKLNAEQIASLHGGAMSNPRVGPQAQVALMTGGGDSAAGQTREPSPEGKAEGEASGSSQAKMTVPYTKSLPVVERKVPTKWGAEFTFKIQLVVEGQVEVSSGHEGGGESGSEVEVSPLGYDDGLAMSIATKWVDGPGKEQLGLDNAISAFKLIETEKKLGMETDEKGTEFAAEIAGKFACGVDLKGEFIFAKIEKNWDVKVAQFKVAAEFPSFPVDVDISQSVKLSDMQIRPAVEVEIEPDWGTILEKAGLKAAEAGTEATAEATTEATAEAGAVGGAVIPAALILGGVAAIGGAILAMYEADELAGTHGKVVSLAQVMTEGFKAGASGGPKPGDPAQQRGYEVGYQNFLQAKALVKNANPAADDTAVQAQVAAQVDQLAAQAQKLIETAAQDVVWNDYASRHVDTWYASYEFVRWGAWSNIYNDDPRGDPRYMRYRNKWTPGKLGC